MISYSLHLSNKKHALTTTKKVAAASKHNLRQYESPQYCRDNIFVLVGGDNILDDLKEAYHQEFDACLEECNKGKRADRQIDDYLVIIQTCSLYRNGKGMLPIFEDQLKHLQELVPDFRIVSAVVHLDEHSPHAHVIGLPIGRGYKRGMQKQAAKTRVFTQESLTELQDKMHKYAEQEMNEHPEIFEGEDLKEIEKGRNSDWSKEFFVRKKAEALESLNEQYAETTNAVEVNETVLEELNKQTEETIQTMVETEAQKEFMRYAFLKEPKTPIGKLVAGAWRKFKEWWDIHKRKEVEEKTRESVLGRLAELKKETAERPRNQAILKKHRGPELD